MDPTGDSAWMFEMSKHSIRIGRLSRLSASRSSSSASIAPQPLAARAPPTSDSSASRAFCVASSCRRRFSPRSAARSSTAAPRCSLRNSATRRQVARVARDDDLRRHARRRAVVLEHEGLEDRRRVLPVDVLEVEAVPVDELAAAEREDLHGRAVALGGDADHVDRADRAPVGGLPLGEVLDRVAGGCGSAPPPRSAPRRPPPSCGARARAGSAASRRRGTRSRRR